MLFSHNYYAFHTNNLIFCYKVYEIPWIVDVTLINNKGLLGSDRFPTLGIADR
ncbi:MAG: hypothetical protein VKL59_12910 [Nostocaceae cyanobacterium]|nr:hypothetical protein [Nostocaceae cyanobacterium]